MLQRIQKYIIPSFLKRLDFWLLTHKPHVWRARGHFVVFYGAIVALLFFLFGLLYPQSLYDLQGYGNNHTDVVFAFTVMSFFLVVGGIFWWWFSIQKYAYKRTSVRHFLIETGIYSVGIFTLWTVFWAFYHGFQYKSCNLLEKNKAEVKTWFFNHSFSDFGYMPHVDPNKLSDLNRYFANGEKLIEIQQKREEVTHKFRQYNAKGHFSFIDADFHSGLGSLYWEFMTSGNNKILPPQYNKVSDYVNALINSDSFHLSESKRDNDEDDEDDDLVSSPQAHKPKDIFVLDKIITNLDYNNIVGLSENIYARSFHHVNYTSKSYSLLNKQIEEWQNQRAFLESLNEKERLNYTVFLKDIYSFYKDEKGLVSIKLPQIAAYNEFFTNLSNSDKDSLGILSYDYSSNRRGNNFGNIDKNTLASEKVNKLIYSFDSDSQKKYIKWLNKIEESFGDKNINDPYLNQLADKAYNLLKTNSIDSLMFYDYYELKLKNFDSYRAFFTNAYVDYTIKKYSVQDFDRLHQLLAINGFPDETPQYKDSKLQKIALLNYSIKYRQTISNLESRRGEVQKTRMLLLSGFSLLYCMLLALFFYVTTLGTGIQFWVSSFISGIYWALMFFIGEITRWGRSDIYNGDTIHNSRMSFPFNFMVMHSVLFILLILYLSNNKTRFKNAQLVVNSVLLSGLGAVMAAVYYWQEIIRLWYYSTPNENYSMSQQDNIRVATNVIIVAIFIYGFAAWLFKRYLTYPKKK